MCELELKYRIISIKEIEQFRRKRRIQMMYNEKMLESFSKEYAERCQVTDKITAELF